MQLAEPVFFTERASADLFCAWLIALGGWAASSPVEDPVIHRLIRTMNPENKAGIPRMDLVVQKEDDGSCTIRNEFRPLFDAWSAFAFHVRYKGGPC